MKRFKQIGAGLILALLLTFTLHSNSEAVADFKACWITPPALGSSVVVVYFSFVGEDTYSVHVKVLSSSGVPELWGAGTMVFGATHIVGSMAMSSVGDPDALGGYLSSGTIDLATLNMNIEEIHTDYNRTTTVIETTYNTFDLAFTPCP